MENNVKIVTMDLTIHYNINDTSVELYSSTNPETPSEFRILDKEMDKRSGATTIEVTSFDEIIKVIKHFKKEFKKLTDETVS